MSMMVEYMIIVFRIIINDIELNCFLYYKDDFFLFFFFDVQMLENYYGLVDDFLLILSFIIKCVFKIDDLID